MNRAMTPTTTVRRSKTVTILEIESSNSVIKYLSMEAVFYLFRLYRTIRLGSTLPPYVQLTFSAVAGPCGICPEPRLPAHIRAHIWDRLDTLTRCSGPDTLALCTSYADNRSACGGRQFSLKGPMIDGIPRSRLLLPRVYLAARRHFAETLVQITRNLPFKFMERCTSVVTDVPIFFRIFEPVEMGI